MNRNLRMLLSAAVYGFGLLASIYIGGWVMILEPIKSTITAYTLGTLTLQRLIIAIVKCFCSLTVAGLIWCMGYIASNYIYDSRDDETLSE